MSKSSFLRALPAGLPLLISATLHAQTIFTGDLGAVAGATTSNAVSAPPAMPTIPAPGLAAALNQAMPAGPQDILRAAEPAEVSRRPMPLREAIPNQFQRFVQESTGQLLPVYGGEFFDKPQAYAADTSLPAPDDHLLAAGDEVNLHVWGPVDFNASLRIDTNGQVNLPKVGMVTLAGVAVRDLDLTLRTHLSKVFVNFSTSASPGRLRGIQVYVVGQAQQPGTFQLSSLSTLVNALFASGGPNANGSMRHIELKRKGKTISTMDLYDFIAKGDKTHDLALMSGDVIVIPPVGPRVAVNGAFDQSAIYELKSTASNVGEILSLGGGVPSLANTQKALLERITGSGNRPRQVQDITLDLPGLKEPMHDGDVLTLLGISPAFANAVTLQGVVAAPLRYRWFEGMAILDLIPDSEALITGDYYKRKNQLVQVQRTTTAAGTQLDSRLRNLVDQINWDYAVVERLDHSKLSTELIPFGLGKLVLQHDLRENLKLRAGDIVTIFSQKDVRVPQERQTRLVRIEGEVVAPGIYQAAAGETLPQILKRLGGLTPQAYLFGTDFSRESVRLRQQESLESLIRKLESRSQTQASVNASNRSTDAVSQAQIMLAQQQQVKAQIERLKSLKSNGRVALELDPQVKTIASLPDLPLEDGDRILIPSVPGFVSAFGSVNNENVYIFKQGKIVADVIKSAGLNEEAEIDQAFVLRADGSIIARRDRSSWLSGSFESLQLMPGDTVVIPSQIDPESRYSLVTRAFKDWTQILGNFGLGAAAIKTLR